MKEISEKMLKRCQIEVTDKGFVVWITEKDGHQHWLIDGSTLKEDGCISLGDKFLDIYDHTALFNEETNGIDFVRMTKKDYAKRNAKLSNKTS